MTSSASASTTLFAPLRRQSQKHNVTTHIRLHCRATSEAPSALPSSTDPSTIVPRRCTLKELTFSEDGRLVTRPSTPSVSKPSELIELFAATVEASAQVKDLETLTGRLSMVAFFMAIAVEYMTGSGVFNTVDQASLQRLLGLGFLTAVGGGAFAVAMRGKRNVTDILSSGCQRIMDSTVDSLVDALFFQEGLVAYNCVDKKETKDT